MTTIASTVFFIFPPMLAFRQASRPQLMCYLSSARQHLRSSPYLGIVVREFSARSNNGHSDIINKAAASSNSRSLEGNKKKRMVALVIGYVGSKYHGLQYNAGTITVEEVLEEALFQAGCILPSNHKDISKIGWSRSSRTDKGVHAARVIIGCKLLLDESWIRADMRIPRIVQDVNQHLPSDVRVFSCYRVSSSFRARKMVNWREYEYVLPMSFLRPLVDKDGERLNLYLNDKDKHYKHDYMHWGNMTNIYDTNAATEEVRSDEELVSLFDAQLRQMVGIHSFHNLCNAKGKTSNLEGNEALRATRAAKAQQEVEELKKRSRRDENGARRLTSAVESADINDAIYACQQDDVEIPDEPAASNKVFEPSYTRKYIYDPNDFVKERFLSLGDFLTSIYKCEVVGVFVADGAKDGEKMLRIRIRGQYFMFNQIRLMLGCAISAVRGLMPPNMTEIALLSPNNLRVPLVPPQGLCLIQNGFDRNGDGNIYVLHGGLQKPHSSVSKAVDLAMMSDDEFEKSEQFHQQSILQQVYADWWPTDQDNRKNLVHEWLHFAEQFRVPKELGEQWMASLDREREVQRDVSIVKKLHGVKRAAEAVDRVLDIVRKFKIPRNLAFYTEDSERVKLRFLKEGKTIAYETTFKTKLVTDRSASFLDKLVSVYGLANALAADPSSRRHILHGRAMLEVCVLLVEEPALALEWIKVSHELVDTLVCDRPSTFQKSSIWIFPCQLVLPNQLVTELVIRFELMPGTLVSTLQRSLALRVLTGELPPTLSAVELVDYVSNGIGSIQNNKSEERIAKLLKFSENIKNCPWIS